MLYDPRWNSPKPNIYTRKALIDWLECEILIKYAEIGSRAIGIRYDWRNPITCLIAQYLGPEHRALPAGEVAKLFGEDVYLALQAQPWTLCAALQRLRQPGD